jgi:DNA-binding transcriptional MocR family regulator
LSLSHACVSCPFSLSHAHAPCLSLTRVCLAPSRSLTQFTFTAALDAVAAHRAHLAPVACDAHGLVPASLEAKCAQLKHRGVRPRALFIIPKGQNPTGSVLRRDRYRAIYDVACKYDFLIIEVRALVRVRVGASAAAAPDL